MRRSTSPARSSAMIEKADEDPAAALRIVKTLDLSALLALEEPLLEELLEIGEDAGRIALASIGIEISRLSW
jgi:hypothetical protein